MKQLSAAFLYMSIAIGVILLLGLIAWFVAYQPTEGDVTLGLIFLLIVALLALFRSKRNRHD